MSAPRFRRCLAFSVASLVSALVESSSAAEESCRRASAQSLVWVHSGEWDGGRLVLGDTGAGELAVLDPATLAWTRKSFPGEGPLEFNKHVVLASEAPGVWISALTRVIQLDSTLKPVAGHSLATAAPGGEVILEKGLRLASGEFVGVAGVFREEASDSWQGIAAVKLRPQVRVEPLRKILADSNEFRFYASLFTYGASLGAKAYWLVMDSEASVLAIDGLQTRTLDLVPESWKAVPKIPAGGFSTIRADLAAMEKQAFPAGLYAMGRELLILHHLPTAQGPTWTLAAVEPDQPTKHRLLTLPTRAPWVTVIPGPDYWALLEQGPVLGPATQTTLSVLLIPAAWLRDPDSPLLRPDARKACSSPSAKGGSGG
jgi:hypothetical protein